MIHLIQSSLPSFKSLELRSGLNAIVAEKTEDATDKQTRNSSGKTSIAWIVHHLLGASCGKKSIFNFFIALEDTVFEAKDTGCVPCCRVFMRHHDDSMPLVAKFL